MLTKKQNLTRESLTVILLLAAVAATEYGFFQLWRLDWHVPMFYGGDGIYWVGQVQRSYGELSGSLGWPFYEVAGRYDPNYDLIYDIFVWFVGLFTKDTGTVFNLYVLVIPFANALAGYAVFRMVGLRRWLSFAFGLTFGLTPYVQQRMAGHMMLAACEFVPFSVSGAPRMNSSTARAGASSKTSATGWRWPWRGGSPTTARPTTRISPASSSASRRSA